MTRATLCFFLLFYTSFSMASNVVLFADGKALVPLSNQLTLKIKAGEILAFFGPEKDHKLEISLSGSLPQKADSSAVDFVVEQANKKALKAKISDKRAVLMEPAGDVKIDNKIFRVVHWMIGENSCVFTMTITAPVPMTDELNQFLGEPLKEIIDKVACKLP